MVTMLDGRTLYRLGTGWVYDISTGIGYTVVRDNSTKGKNSRGKVVGFIEAFSTIENDGKFGAITMEDSDVPLGIIRKAISICEKLKSGELEPRNVSYS